MDEKTDKVVQSIHTRSESAPYQTKAEKAPKEKRSTAFDAENCTDRTCGCRQETGRIFAQAKDAWKWETCIDDILLHELTVIPGFIA